MSVVNDMLKNLDRRAGAHPGIAGLAAPVPEEPGRERAERQRRVIVLGAVTVVVAGVVLWTTGSANRLVAMATQAWTRMAKAPPAQVASPAPVASAPAVQAPAKPPSNEGGVALPEAKSLRPTPLVEEKGPAVPPAEKAPVAAAPEPAKPAAPEPPKPAASEPGSDFVVRRHEATPAAPARTSTERAREAITAGRLDEAQAALEETLAREPTSDYARKALVAILLKKGSTGEARRVLRDGLVIAPDQADWGRLHAQLSLQAGEAQEAVRALERVVAVTALAEDHELLAAALFAAGRRPEAIANYEAALRLAPTSGRAYVALGAALEAMGRAKEARDAYRGALEIASLSPELRAYAEGRIREAAPAR